MSLYHEVNQDVSLFGVGLRSWFVTSVNFKDAASDMTPEAAVQSPKEPPVNSGTGAWKPQLILASPLEKEVLYTVVAERAGNSK